MLRIPICLFYDASNGIRNTVMQRGYRLPSCGRDENRAVVTAGEKRGEVLVEDGEGSGRGDSAAGDDERCDDGDGGEAGRRGWMPLLEEDFDALRVEDGTSVRVGIQMRRLELEQRARPVNLPALLPSLSSSSLWRGPCGVSWGWRG